MKSQKFETKVATECVLKNFAIKVAGIQTCNFVKETLTLVFSFEISENSCARISFLIKLQA